MAVLQLISSEGYYGAENMVVVLAHTLSRLGRRCIVAAFRDSRQPHLEVAEHAQGRGLEVEAVPCDGRWDWKVVGRIRALVDRHRIRVLHTHGYKADVCGFAALRGRDTALVSTCHNWPSRRLIMRAYAHLDRLVLRQFDRVAAVSEPVAEVLIRSGVLGPTVVSNGVAVEAFSGAVPTLPGDLLRGCDRRVGFVGRLVPEKGGAVLLEAAVKVLAARPRTGIVFVGDGPSGRDWASLAARLGISANVAFLGARTDMPGIYASLDILVLPSFVEGTPMCVLEAMASGKPVVATRVGSVPSIIRPGRTGLLVEAGDADGLAEAVLRLLTHEDLARTLAEQGRAQVAAHSAEAMTTAYLALYEQAVAARGRRESQS